MEIFDWGTDINNIKIYGADCMNCNNIGTSLDSKLFGDEYSGMRYSGMNNTGMNNTGMNSSEMNHPEMNPSGMNSPG